MAVEIKYRLTLGGSLITSEGTKTDKISDAMEFSTLDEASNFISASGSLGEYHLRTYVVKS
jgi:hypothetical protein